MPIVYDSSGNLLSVSLYTKLQPGTSMTVKVGRSYLDQDNMHNPDIFRIGNAQVVSMKDDKTLSSTANAMKDFFTGTNNTVGIVPDLGKRFIKLRCIATISIFVVNNKY